MDNDVKISTEDLQELNEIFKSMGGVDKVADYTGSYQELEDGNYTGEIEKALIKNSKNTGRPMIEICVALEGDKKEYVHLMLAGENLQKTQGAIARAVTQLSKLGLSGSELGDFISKLDALVGKRVNLEIKTGSSGYRAKTLTLV